MIKYTYLFLTVLFCFSCGVHAQKNSTGDRGNHPRIYGTSEMQAEFAATTDQVEWKKQIVEKKKETIDKYIDLCASDPEWLVSRLQMNWNTKHDRVFLKGGKFSHSEGEAPVPTVRFSGTRDWASNYASPSLEDIQPYFDDPRGMYLKNRKTNEMEWVHPSETGHIIEGINARIMGLVEDAAFLYWLTGDTKYADFAFPVYDTYMKGMYYREAPVDLENSSQQNISGLATFEVIHEQIVTELAVSYDFLFNYLTDKGYDLDMSAAVFQKWGDQIIKNGIPDNNWNFFQARFLTYIALALDDNSYYENGKGQQYYLDHTFTVSTDRQIALKEAILNYDQQNGMWPECASYSMHVTSTLLEILTVLDNVTNVNEFENFPIVEKATLAAFQYLFPNGYVVGFGDSRHLTIPAESFEFLIANYRKYGKKEQEKQITALYNPGEKTRGKDLFELFFYVDELVQPGEIKTDELIANLTSPTFYAPNVSWFMQRMGTGSDATVVSTVGGFGNHAHANGVALELYANNYVLAPEMGKGPSYWHEDHRNYYSRYPAHNTVVVDGISDSEAMRVEHPFTLDNHFPESGDRNNVFRQVTFSKVSFVEPTTLANQQRLTAIINSESGKAYVFDVFRSERPGREEQKHEYFFHSLGQSLNFFYEDGRPLSLKPSAQLNTAGNLKAYDYFTDEKSFASTENVNAQFKLESKGNAASLMNVWIKGGENRHYFSVNGPKSNAIEKGTAPVEMLDAKVPTMVIRKNGEAWNNPFVAVYNPVLEGEKQVISMVAYPKLVSNPSAQLVRVTHEKESTVDFIVATSSENDIVKTDDFYQKGLLSITRENASDPEFIFAAGVTRYSRNGWEFLSVREPVTLSIEKCDRGFEIQNDEAVLIGMPETINPDFVELYADGKLIETRKGVRNRNNPDRVDFRFEKPFERAVIVLKK
ncbi:heparinase II/III family protein [Mangrovibacterium sp.]|uniref:heparinase II/III domain-containing protein n=1 Tax=Mangrovibacterium sp. TaxID=1961364 RepID=UPI0035613D3C